MRVWARAQLEKSKDEGPGDDVIDGPGVEDDGPVLLEALSRRWRCTALALVVLAGAAQHRRVVDRPKTAGVVGAWPPPPVAARALHKAPADPLCEIGGALPGQAAAPDGRRQGSEDHARRYTLRRRRRPGGDSRFQPLGVRPRVGRPPLDGVRDLLVPKIRPRFVKREPEGVPGADARRRWTATLVPCAVSRPAHPVDRREGRSGRRWNSSTSRGLVGGGSHARSGCRRRRCCQSRRGRRRRGRRR